MNAVGSILIGVAILFGGGYALKKIYAVVKGTALDQIHLGQPSLSAFSNKMTCTKFSDTGAFVKIKWGCHSTSQHVRKTNTN